MKIFFCEDCGKTLFGKEVGNHSADHSLRELKYSLSITLDKKYLVVKCGCGSEHFLKIERLKKILEEE